MDTQIRGCSSSLYKIAQMQSALHIHELPAADQKTVQVFTEESPHMSGPAQFNLCCSRSTVLKTTELYTLPG